MQIVMDNITYNLRVKYESIKRAFTVIEGQNKGTTLAHKTLRDVVGTGYSYTMQVEPDPADPTDYDDFFNAISAPTDYHEITLPFGQTTLTFNAAVASGQDTFAGKLASVNQWTGLTVTFSYIEPART